MKPAITCPSRQELERLHQGQVPFAQVEPLARHLEQCDACLRTFQAWENDDTLVAVLRQHVRTGTSEADPVVEELIERIRNLKESGGTATSSEAPTLAPGRSAPAEDVPHDFLAPPQGSDELGRLGQYRVLRLLGAGGMGVVYLAEDLALRRPVALKVMNPNDTITSTDRKRFLREAQAAASIKHDHIVTIYQVGEDRGVPYLAMEFLEGTSLEDRLKEAPPLPLAEVLRIAREIAEGLAAAHARGLIHRDIKPANLWLERQPGRKGAGRVKILDFGLARPVASNAQLTERGAIVGTPAYMAPEQTTQEPVDARCDLFSLGSVLYRLCAGRPPFRGRTSIDVLVNLVTETPPPVRQLNPALPPAVADLIGRLMSKDPRGRPASARAVIDALRAIEHRPAHRPTAHTTELPSPAASRRRPRWLWPVVAAAAALVLGGALVGQFVVRIKNKDGKVVQEIPLPPGGTAEVVPARQPEAGEPQVEALCEKLKRRNPDFDGHVEHRIENGVVTELKFRSNHVRDLSPLHALTGLKVLHCWGDSGPDGKGLGMLTDLGPLKDLALIELNLANNPGVTDLKPLQYLPVKVLDLSGTPVNDLDPLRFLPLRTLSGHLDSDEAVNTLRLVWTLETINGRPAIEYWMKHDPQRAALLQWIEDSKKLRGKERIEAVRAKLKERNPGFDGRMGTPSADPSGEVTDVSLIADQIEDLSPLRAFPRLARLSCPGNWQRDWRRRAKLKELAPLRGLPLVYLDVRDTHVSSLTPLRHLPLKSLVIGDTSVGDLSPLRGMSLDALSCYYTGVKDLSPLQGMPLRGLTIDGCAVRDLKPLHGMPLIKLGGKQTPFQDLTPLEGTPLAWLDCSFHRAAPDFTPLRKTPIREIFCETPERQAASLSLLWSLEKINGRPALEFFEKNNPAHAAFLRWIAVTRELPAEQQLAEVRTKLNERNPALDGNRVTGHIENGKVIVLSLPAVEVTDLGPVRALRDLQALSCTGTPDCRGRLSDLSRLAGLRQLNKLYLSRTAVADLAPLAGLGLRFLHCDGTAVKDLTPVRRMNLEELDCDPELARGNRALLQGIKTLKVINNRPAAEFWKELDAGKP